MYRGMVCRSPSQSLVHDEGMSPDFDGHAEWVEYSFWDNKAKGKANRISAAA